MQLHEVAIIGGGPAGMAVALQLRRYGVDFLLFERAALGGLLRNAHWVENYPGFPRGISGPALVRRMKEHLRIGGIGFVHSEVTQVTDQPGLFHLSTPLGDICARVLVIATGTKPRLFTDFDIPSHLQARVLYEVHSLADVAQRRIAIVGAGDAAFDYALQLSRRNQVLIFNRGEHPACLPLLWERAAQSRRIIYHAGTRIVRLAEHPTGELLLDGINPSGPLQFRVDLLIGALGREPCQDFIADEFRAAAGALEAQGRLYWIGDVKNGIERQTAIAVGDGIRAAMKISRWLKDPGL